MNKDEFWLLRSEKATVPGGFHLLSRHHQIPHGHTSWIHSPGPGRVVGGADVAAVDKGGSGVGSSIVVGASGRGVVPTLRGGTDGDVITSSFAEVTGAAGLGESL